MKSRLLSTKWQLKIVQERILSRIYKILPFMATGQDDTRVVRVRNAPGEDRINISLLYFRQLDGAERYCSLSRGRNESVGTSLVRLKANLEKFEGNNKRKKSSNVASKSVNVELICPDGTPVLDDLTNEMAWLATNVLSIGESTYKIIVNIPAITLLKLPKYIMAGYTVYPKLSVEFCDTNLCKFEWSVGNDSESMKIVGCDPTFTPSAEAVGWNVQLSCTPSNGKMEGTTKSVIAESTVQAPPQSCPFEERHKLTSSVTANNQ